MVGSNRKDCLLLVLVKIFFLSWLISLSCFHSAALGQNIIDNDGRTSIFGFLEGFGRQVSWSFVDNEQPPYAQAQLRDSALIFFCDGRTIHLDLVVYSSSQVSLIENAHVKFFDSSSLNFFIAKLEDKRSTRNELVYALKPYGAFGTATTEDFFSLLDDSDYLQINLVSRNQEHPFERMSTDGAIQTLKNLTCFN